VGFFATAQTTHTDGQSNDDDVAVDNDDAANADDDIPLGKGGKSKANEWWLFGLVLGLVFGLFIIIVLVLVCKKSSELSHVSTNRAQRYTSSGTPMQTSTDGTPLVKRDTFYFKGQNLAISSV
jgi:hypothetical protein